MKIIPLPAETQALLGFSHKIMLDYTDLNGTSAAFTSAWTSGTAQALFPQNTIGASSKTIAAGIVVDKVVANVTTAFTSSGGAITSLTFSLGDGGSATRFLNAVDLKTAGYTAGTTSRYAYNAADTIDGVATISGQTVASLNAGALEIYVNIQNAADLVAVV